VVVNRTAIVVGAGASTEVGLPTGGDLRHRIASLLDIKFDFRTVISGDERIASAIEAKVKNAASFEDFNAYLGKAWQIRDAMPQALSIDNYIDAHRGDEQIELCGKLAIVRSILEAEAESSLAFDERSPQPGIDFSRIESTWLNRSFQVLTENCRVEDLESRLRNISFIVFNYDRCVEHFLFHALRNYYRIDDKAAAHLVACLEIYHPYGRVGYLPWQRQSPGIAYGGSAGGELLLKLASQIRTFTEGTDPEVSNIDSIRHALRGCDICLFLGFAFHVLNMELLKHDSNTEKAKSVFGTAFGVSNHDCVAIKEDVQAMGIRPIRVLELRNDLRCNELFLEYRRTLARSW